MCERIEFAKRLLEATDLTIDVIGERVGRALR